MKESPYILSYFFGRSDVALPGFSKYFAKESLQERAHADNLLIYINKRGGKIKFDEIKPVSICKDMIENMTICEHIFLEANYEQSYKVAKLGLLAMKEALSLEKYVTQKLLEIISTDDYQLNHFIEHEYLDEQVVSIKVLGDYIRQLEMFSDDQYFLGQYIFDQNLSKMFEDSKDQEKMPKFY